MLGRFFRLAENQTSARVELLAWVTTFLTTAYFVFVRSAM
jgi:xanthine/uracil/vitamin C permease (AzgA family)